MYAIYDNATMECRQVWRYGNVVTMITLEVLEDEYGTAVLESLRKREAFGADGMADAGAWQANRIIGGIEHIPLPYRP